MLVEGTLEKQSSGLRKRWQKRHFEVAGHYLKYYADASKAELKGAVDLKEATPSSRGSRSASTEHQCFIK